MYRAAYLCIVHTYTQSVSYAVQLGLSYMRM